MYEFSVLKHLITIMVNKYPLLVIFYFMIFGNNEFDSFSLVAQSALTDLIPMKSRIGFAPNMQYGLDEAKNATNKAEEADAICLFSCSSFS